MSSPSPPSAPLPLRRLPGGRLRRQRGISLIEMVLAIGLSVLLLASLSRLLADSQRELKAADEAESLQSFQRAAAEYFLANRTALLAVMAEGGDDAGTLCRILVPADGVGGTPGLDLATHTCRIDASLLKTVRMLPAAFPETNGFGERPVAIFRHIHDEDGMPTGNADLLVVSTLSAGRAYQASDSRHATAQSAARILGAAGGAVPDGDRGVCRALRGQGLYEVCGAGWKLGLDAFLTSDELGAFAALLPE